MSDKQELYPAPVRYMLSIPNQYPDDALKQAHYVNGCMCGLLGAMYDDIPEVQAVIDRILAERNV